MELKQALQEFEEIKERLKAYQYALNLANWDLATLAPPKGKAGAAKAMGVLSGEAFQIKTSEQMKDILKAFEKEEKDLSPVVKREAEILREEMEELDKIPKKEYQEFTELQSTSQFVWEDAKNKSDFEMFAPYLEKLVDYTRRFGALKKPELHPYDACLDDYEKGNRMPDLDEFFRAVKEKTVPLVEKIAREGRAVGDSFNGQKYNLGRQQEIAYKILKTIGFDLEAGVLAVSEHPFTNEINRGDVRLTTHYYEQNLISSILTTAHEGGHGIYEQNAKNSELIKGSMLDEGVSMGIHESQSRFYENVICRSRDFWVYFYPVLKEEFPDQLKNVEVNDFYRAINIAKPGLIRVESDELTYNLHIMIRYELEKALLGGDITVSQLPKLWNEKYEEYLGVTPSNDKEGVLQDVHWSMGAFGYFPSYALGNAYAAQIYHKMGQELDIPGLCRKGELAPVTAWLNERIHQYGMLKKPGELIVDITGEKLNPGYLTDYLERKFGEIYF